MVALFAVHVGGHGGGGGGGGGKGKGGGHGGGGHGGGYGEPYYAQQSFVEYRPVTIQKPVVVQRPILIHPAPPPQLVHKPVVHHVQEWRLVTVPKVTYKPIYVQAIPNIGGGGGKGKGGGKGGKGGFGGGGGYGGGGGGYGGW